MTKPVHTTPSKASRAPLDPTLATASPEEIAHHPGLTLKQRIELLRSRQYDAAEIAVAEEEGMQGPENDQMREILLALAELTHGEDDEPVAPTKQHGHP
jgi:hypothetical protein